MGNDRGIEKQIRALREAKFTRVRVVKIPMRELTEKEVSAAIAAKPEMIFESPPCVGHSKPKIKTPPAPPATQETDVKKPKTKTAEKRKPKAREKKTKTLNVEAAKKANAPKKGVPATEVADFICRAPGASMADLVKKFGIEAHPMRAKIFYAKHELGYAIENADGRYTGTPPKQ